MKMTSGLKRYAAMLAMVVSAVIAPAVGLFGAGAVSVACGGTVVPTNAIATAQTVAQDATTAVADAQTAWPIVYALIPAAQQAAAQDAFTKGVFAANHAILALNDAIAAAIAANNPSPDFTTLISQLGDAVAQVVDIVKNFQGQAPASAERMRTSSGVDAFADMQRASDAIKASAKKK